MAPKLVRTVTTTDGVARATILHKLLFELIILLYHFCVVLPLDAASDLTARAAAAMTTAVTAPTRALTATVTALITSPARALAAAVTSHVNALWFWCFSRLAERFYAVWLVRSFIPKQDLGLEFGPSVSFGGGGMLWCYYLGVGHFLFKNFDIARVKFLASSGGCFAAVPLAMGRDPYEWCRRDWPYCLTHYRTRPLGCFLDQTAFYRTLWSNYLPEDAHIRATDRLFLSITLFPSFKNRVVSRFATRDDLINCIIASTCLPVVFLRDIPRTSHGLALDGGLTNDQPCIDRYTVTVSVLNEEADVKPVEALSVLDMVNIPTLNSAFRTARRAEKDAARVDCWRRSEWQQVRRPLPAPTPKLTAHDRELTMQRCGQLVAKSAHHKV